MRNIAFEGQIIFQKKQIFSMKADNLEQKKIRKILHNHVSKASMNVYIYSTRKMASHLC